MMNACSPAAMTLLGWYGGGPPNWIGEVATTSKPRRSQWPVQRETPARSIQGKPGFFRRKDTGLIRFSGFRNQGGA
jgi:hypothetical protein